jgi:glycosyltransferase involved in cell wall biosynthesis
MRQASIGIVIPCYNEQLTVGQVIEDCRQALPQGHIYVFDNRSTDQTSACAKAAGATVIFSPHQGKGEVIRHAFSTLDEDVLVILDGDGTYSAAVAPDMVRAVWEDHFDMVVCNRKAKSAEAYPKFHKLGNRLFSAFMTTLIGQKVGDVFSGYRAFSREFYESVAIESSGFEIESELSLKAISHGFYVKELEAPYGHRPAGSVSKLNTFTDGLKILRFILMLMRDCRPLLFFGSGAVVCFLLSLASGWAPIQDYIQFHYVYTVPRAILAAGLMTVAMMLLAVGLILDSQIRNMREQSKLVRRWLTSEKRRLSKAA